LIPSAGPGETDPFRQVERFLSGVRESRAQLSVFGFPLFLLFSTRFFSGTRTALNEVFDTHESRSWWKGLGLDFGLVMAALLVVVTSTALTVQLAGLPFSGRLLSSVSTFALGVLLFCLIYKVSPTRHVRWDTAFVAAAVAALGFEVLKRMYVVYLVEFTTLDRLISNNNVIALVLLVVWMYFTACIFLLGAEVAETYDLCRRQSEQRAILT
jgi:membrane protein